MRFYTNLWLMQNHCALGSKKRDGFMRVYDGTRCLVLFCSEK